MTAVVFDPALFRAQCKEFADETAYPDVLLDSAFAQGSCYLSPEPNAYLSAACLLPALNNMTAHILKLQELIAVGQTPSIISATATGKVSVTLVPPVTSGDPYNWWLATTGYGQSVLAQLSVASAAGFMSEGFAPLSAYPSPAGGFFYS